MVGLVGPREEGGVRHVPVGALLLWQAKDARRRLLLVVRALSTCSRGSPPSPCVVCASSARSCSPGARDPQREGIEPSSGTPSPSQGAGSSPCGGVKAWPLGEAAEQ